jgi:hypothetical protein
MYINSKNIMNVDNTPFIIRGFNEGHGELTIPNDPYEDRSLGANTVRIIFREFGPYGTVIKDGLEVDSPGNLKPAYLQDIVDRVTAAKRAGLKVILCGDSNCGQNGNQDTATATFCTINGLPGQNFWTRDGQPYFQYFLGTWDWLSRQLYGLVDFYEPIVEPSAPTATQVETWILQEKIRNVILKNDPAALFIIGAYPSYFANAMSSSFYAPWAAQGNTIWTCDMLDGTSMNTATVVTDIAILTTFRTTNNVPVMVQQVGTLISNDPNSTALSSVLTALNTASGGSIGFTIWEKVSQSATSYGPYAANGVGIDRTVDSTRLAICSARFNDAKIAAT